MSLTLRLYSFTLLSELYTIDDVDEVLYDEPPIEAQPPIEPSINSKCMFFVIYHNFKAFNSCQ